MPASSTVEPSVRTSIRAHRTPTVVFVILDGLPVRRVDELSMPIVHRLRGDCRLAAPAMSVLTSATYPSPDSAGHLYGPDSAEAADSNRAADQAVGQIVAALGRIGHDAVLIVVSDHDQITIENPYPIDLQPALDRIAGVTGDQPGVVIEGDAAIVTVPADHSGRSVFDTYRGSKAASA